MSDIVFKGFVSGFRVVRGALDISFEAHGPVPISELSELLLGDNNVVKVTVEATGENADAIGQASARDRAHG